MKTHTLLRNTKALSPVIATIILVAVTVAIAIAVAAWLGALTFTYTNVEQLNITGASMSVATATLSMSNSGTSDVTISSVTARGGSTFNNAIGAIQTTGTSGCTSVTQGTAGSSSGQATVPKGGSCTLSVLFTPTFVAGTSYSFTLTSAKGHTFPYTSTA